MPFLLRRTKEEVLTDLPPKIIQDRLVDLSPLQVKLYEDFSRSDVRQEVSSLVQDAEGEAGPAAEGVPEQASTHVFQALQVSNGECYHKDDGWILMCTKCTRCGSDCPSRLGLPRSAFWVFSIELHSRPSVCGRPSRNGCQINAVAPHRLHELTNLELLLRSRNPSAARLAKIHKCNLKIGNHRDCKFGFLFADCHPLRRRPQRGGSRLQLQTSLIV